MKLHLPSRLRSALLACMALLSPIVPSVSGVALAAGVAAFALCQAEAAEYEMTLPGSVTRLGKGLFNGEASHTAMAAMTAITSASPSGSAWYWGTGNGNNPGDDVSINGNVLSLAARSRLAGEWVMACLSADAYTTALSVSFTPDSVLAYSVYTADFDSELGAWDVTRISAAPDSSAGNLTTENTPVSLSFDNLSLNRGDYILLVFGTNCTGGKTGGQPEKVSGITIKATYVGYTWKGGDGDWDSSTENWTQDGSGATFSDGSVAHFASGSGTVTVSQDISTSYLSLGENAVYTFAVEDGKVLEISDISLASGASATITGTGTVAASVSDALKLSIDKSTDSGWKGTLTISGGQKGIDLAKLVNGSISTLECNGITGWSNNTTPLNNSDTSQSWKGNNTYNVKLTDNRSNKAWVNGAYSTQSTETCEFSGKWSGSGTFVASVGDGRMNYTYSGNISQWTGAFEKTGKGATTLTFTGAASTVNATISRLVGNLAVVADTDATFSKSVTADAFTVNAGKTATFSGVGQDYSIGTLAGGGTLKVTDGSLSLTNLSGKLTFSGGGYKGGTIMVGDSTSLTIDGTVKVGSLSQLTASGSTIPTGNGYTTATYTLAEGTGTITMIPGSDSKTYASVAGERYELSSSSANGSSTLTFTTNGSSGTYYVNTGSVNYDNAANATTDPPYTVDIDAEKATGIVLNGADVTLNMNLSLSSVAVDKISVKNNATINLAKSDVVLNKSDVSVDTGKALTLTGSGNYVIASPGAAITLGTEVQLGEDWAGTVTISGGQNGSFFANLVNGTKSTLEFNGVTGWSDSKSTASWAGEQSFNVKLTDNGTTKAWVCGAYPLSTAANATGTFSGKWSGDGTFQTANAGPKRMDYTYTGNISEWTGTFEKTGNGETILTFTGAANSINATILHSAGSLTIVADTDATFSKSVTADAVTVNAGKSAVFNGTLKTTTLTANAYTTLTGSGNVINTLTANADTTLGGDGNVINTLAGTGKLLVNGGTTEVSRTLTGATNVEAAGGELTLAGGIGSSYTGAITGVGNIKSTGDIGLGGNVLENFAGTLTLGAGSILSAAAAAVVGGTVALEDGAKVAVGISNQLTLNKLTLGGTGAIDLGGRTFNQWGNTYELMGVKEITGQDLTADLLTNYTNNTEKLMTLELKKGKLVLSFEADNPNYWQGTNGGAWSSTEWSSAADDTTNKREYLSALENSTHFENEGTQTITLTKEAKTGELVVGTDDASDTASRNYTLTGAKANLTATAVEVKANGVLSIDGLKNEDSAITNAGSFTITGEQTIKSLANTGTVSTKGLTVTGDVTGTGTLAASGDVSVGGKLGESTSRVVSVNAAGKDLSVTGETFAGDVEAASANFTGAADITKLTTSGEVRNGAGLTLGDGSSIGGALTGDKALTTSGTVSITGAATVSDVTVSNGGTLNVGSLTASGNFNGAGTALNSTGDIAITGTAAAASITSAGNLTLSQGATVSGMTSATRVLTLGGSLSTYGLSASSITLTGDLDPTTPRVTITGTGGFTGTSLNFTIEKNTLIDWATEMSLNGGSYTLLSCTSTPLPSTLTLNNETQISFDKVGTLKLESTQGIGVVLTFERAISEWLSTDGNWNSTDDNSGFTFAVPENGIASFLGKGTQNVNVNGAKKVSGIEVNIDTTLQDPVRSYTLIGDSVETKYLSIKNGGLVVSNNLKATIKTTVDAGGTLEVSGENGLQETPLLVNAGELVVSGGELKVTDTLTNSGSMEITSGITNVVALNNQTSLDAAAGALTVSGGELTVSGTLTNDGNMSVSGGTVTLANLVNSDTSELTLTGGSTTLTNATNSGSLTVGAVSGGDSDAVSGAELTFGALTNANGGTLTVGDGGVVTAEGSTLTNAGSLTVESGGTVTIYSYDDSATTAVTTVEEGAIFTVLDGKVGDKALEDNKGTIELETLNGTTADTTLAGTVLVHGESTTPFSGSYASGVRVGTTENGNSVGNLALNAGENLTVVGEVGHITVTGLTDTTNPENNKLGGIETTGASVTLDNANGTTPTTVWLVNGSTMENGVLEFTVSATEVNKKLAADKNDKPTVTTNAALSLTNVTLKVKEVESTNVVRTPGGPEKDIILFVLGDHEDSTMSGVDLDLSGCSWMTKYFTNFRVVQGSINVVADANTGHYAAQGQTPNGTAGLALAGKAMFHLDPQTRTPGSELAQVLNMLDQSNGNAAAMDKLGAALAGSSLSAVGMAVSDDVQRQLRSIRNRTTTMGVNECVVNEDMPYVNGWISGDGNYRQLSESGTDAGYQVSSWGGTVGVDVDVNPNLTLGVAVSALFGDYTGKAADTLTGDLDTQYVSLFARVSTGSWVNTFVGTLGRADVDLERTLPGIAGKTTYKTNGMMFGFLYEVARTFALNEDASTCVQPLFNMSFTHTSLDSATEGGAADTRLTTDSASLTQFSLGLGGRLQSIVGENEYNRASIFEARALLKLDFGDRYNKLNTALAALPNATVATRSNESGVIGAEVGATLTIPLSQDAGSVFFDMNADFRADQTGVNGSVGYRINF